MSSHHRSRHSQTHPLPLLSRNHTTSTTPSNLLLAPDGGIFDSELEHRWKNVKARLSAVLHNMQDYPIRTIPTEWEHIYTDVAKLYTENDAVRKKRMYGYVRQFIREHVKVQLHHLRPLRGTFLLSEYVRRWRTTMAFVQFMKRVLHHQQRFWVSENANTLKQDPVRPLDKLLMFYWREDLLSNLHSIVDIALSLVDDDRRGIRIDHSAVRGIVDNFVEIGAADVAFHNQERDPDDAHRLTVQDLSTLQLYIQVFEDRYLVHTRRFYKEEGALMAHSADVSSFIKQVKACLDEEEKRAGLLLHKDSAPRVRKAVEEQLIGNHKEFLQLHANNMIENGNEDDLRLAYNLLDRIDGAMDPVKAFFVRFVRKEGNEVIASHVAKLNGKEEIPHNLVLVELLVRLYLKHASMVKRCFEGVSKIMLAIDDAFRGFVNCTHGAVSLPNLLAHYIDKLLKSNRPAGSLFLTAINSCSKSDQENSKLCDTRSDGRDWGIGEQSKSRAESLDSTIDPRARYVDELVRILMYLDDKDMFFEAHRRLFAKRLLSDLDEEMETLFITKLREQMGTTYTQRLSGMLQDIKISNSLTEEFANHLSQEKHSGKEISDDDSRRVLVGVKNALEIEFEAHVLNALHWPSVKVTDLVLPSILQECQKTFSSFYMKSSETRKLTWIHNMSTVHVRATLGRGTYTLLVSTIQACALMLFNETEEISVVDAAKKLNISCEDLKRHMKPLLVGKKSKVLTLQRRSFQQAPQLEASPEWKLHSSENGDRERLGFIKEPLPATANGERKDVSQPLGSGSMKAVTDGPQEERDDEDKLGSPGSHLYGCRSGVQSIDQDLHTVKHQENRRTESDSRKGRNVSNLNCHPTEATQMEQRRCKLRPSTDDSDVIKPRSPATTQSDSGEMGADNDGVLKGKRSLHQEVLLINHEFSSRQHRVVVSSVMPRPASVEATVSRKNVDIDRSTQVDAAVMRIMKLRKKVAHGDLCAEVILKMSTMTFTPDVKLIKGRLDRLIDQDYIVRDEKDPRVYCYNA